jgi:polyisoprenoid-binding protein YceI
MSQAQQRSRLLRTFIGVLVAVGVVVGGPWAYARFIAAEPEDALALATATTTTTPQVPTGVVDIEGTWYVQPGSEAGYRLNESLSGQQVTVVGRTEMASGSVVIEGGALVLADFSVDVGSIATDEPARDAFFRRALDTSAFPNAMFALTEPVDVSAIGLSDAPASVTVAGDLTMHGVTKPVTAALQVQRVAGGVEMAGQVPVTIADFDVAVPDLDWVSVEATGVVEVLLVFGSTPPAA